MESRIANILNRMNEENRKLKELRARYSECELARKANYIRINAYVSPDSNNRYGEDIWLKLEGDITKTILDLIGEHYIKLGKQYKQNLEDLLEEMKQE